jgi:hypothetical protein
MVGELSRHEQRIPAYVQPVISHAVMAGELRVQLMPVSHFRKEQCEIVIGGIGFEELK